jgi:hypothetical protein
MRNGRLRVALVCAALLIGVASLPVALFGLRQLFSTTVEQLSGPAQITDFVAIHSGARLLITDPAHLYAPGAVAAIDRALTGTDRFDRPFSFLPHAALLLAPIGTAPYGLAYSIWLIVGLIAVGLSVWLLAPRRWLWPILSALYLPVQLALIMGQTPPLALLAFCGLVRLLPHRPGLTGVLLGLSPITWKPQLFLPTLAVALAAGRRWRTLGGLLGVPAVLCGGVLAIAGLRLIVDYQQQGAEMLTQVGTGRSVESAGQTLLGLCQSIFGPGPIAAALAIAGSVLVELAIGMMWWRGLRADARSSLQLAAVPVAAVLAAPHALGYELTTWLASAWLLLRYAQTRATVQPLVVLLCLSGWVTGNVIILTENDIGFPWAAVQGVATLCAIGWLYRTHERSS